MKPGRIEVHFNNALLDEIADVIAEQGGIRFLAGVKERVSIYAPKDTETLVNSNFIVRGDKEIALCYGSKHGDDRLNQIAIMQHEMVLHHFGTPGGDSMRQGTGSPVPGLPHAIGGHSLPESNTMQMQKQAYSQGYRDKRQSGMLTPYASKYLLYAAEDEAVHAIKHYKGINLGHLKSKRSFR
jgi:hypothetical protein